MTTDIDWSKAQLQEEVGALRRRVAELEAERVKWQAQDAQFRQIFENAATGIALVDMTGRVLRANQALQDMLGRPEAELCTLSFVQLTHPDDVAKDWALFQEMVAKRRDSYQIEKRYVRRDGTLLWGRLTVSLLREAGEADAFVLGIVEDITQRKQMELNERAQRELAEALRDTAAALNSTLDISEVFDRILENVGRVVAHDSASIMLIDADQATARLARTRGHAQDAAIEYVARVGLPVGEVANLRRMRDTGRPILVPDTELDPDWVQLVQSAAGQQMRSYLGAPIKIKRQVVGFINLNSLQPYFFTRSHALGLQVFADQAGIAIENARLFEAQQRQLAAQAALLNAARALASTLELDSILAALAGQLGEALDVTSVYICAWHAASGQSEVLAQWASAQANDSERQPCVGHIYDLVKDFGDDLDQWLFPGRPFISQVDDPSLYEPARQHMLAYGGQSALTVPLVVKGRSIGYVDLWESRRKRRFQPAEIALAQGIAQQAAMAMDNAQLYAHVRRHAAELEQHVAERTRELTEANARLAELDRLKDEFLSRISHELRTPLTAVKIYIDLLEHGKPEKQARYREVIRENADKLQRLIEDLLRISDLDLGDLPADIQPINLNQVARDQITAHSTAARLRELTLAADLAEALPPAQADARLLAQAVSNLIVNALNYTPGHGTVTVRTGQRDEDGRWLTLTVADTGPGILPEDMPRIFERFYRGHAARDYTRPGVGVGLSISRTLIERLGGRITVESVPGAGAAFTVWLRPAKPDGEAA